MKNILYRFLCLCLCLCLLFVLWACDESSESKSSSSEHSSQVSHEQEYEDTVTILDSSKMFTDRDLNAKYDENAVLITLYGDSYSCSSENVSINDSQITISAGGDYIIRGSSSNCTVVVDASVSDKVCLVLDGASIASVDFAPIYVKNAKKVFILAKGECYLSSLGEFVRHDIGSANAVIFSKEDITFQGDGTLNISTNYGHGIACKGTVKITSLKLNIDASAHAISAKDSLRVRSAQITANAGKDALHAEHQDDSSLGYIYLENGKLELTCMGDSLDASGNITLNGSKIEINAGADSAFSSSVSKKGIKAVGDIAILGGDVSINSVDDALHSNASLLISGGKISITSYDDGIHADSLVSISGGETSILKSYEGIEGQRVLIKGGKLSIIASDDGINAGGGNDGSAIGGRPGQNIFDTETKCSIDILGGDIYVNAKGDGIDSNGTVAVSGGRTIVEGPTNNKNGPFDYDISAKITGGIFVAIGSPGMAMNFSSATQGAILYNFENTVSAGSELKVYDGSELVLEHTCTKQFVSVLVSAPALEVGGTYKLCAGAQSVDITLSNIIYGKGYHSGMIK